jgi:hypothetical protein
MDIDKIVKDMKRTTRKICGSRKSARKFLVDAGIYTKTGKLRRPYR